MAVLKLKPDVVRKVKSDRTLAHLSGCFSLEWVCKHLRHYMQTWMSSCFPSLRPCGGQIISLTLSIWPSTQCDAWYIVSSWFYGVNKC